MTLKDKILDFSRQNNIAPLSPWFQDKLDQAILDGYYPAEHTLELISAKLVHGLAAYRVEADVSTAVLGMSGGVDSALTAALFKKAGWRVIGVTMPIHQVQVETDRGVEACKALGIEHRHIDLSALYEATLTAQDVLDADLALDDNNNPAVRIRRGNVRARLRMITLYNLASKEGGLVASTDNFSELGSGFWTLHGDVGDLAPIQSLLKSWEVPYLAMLNGVPESTYRATPTDGNATVAGGDEAQLGCSYLEWDLMTYALATGGAEIDLTIGGTAIDPKTMRVGVAVDHRRQEVYDAVTRRMGKSWFKRKNPMNLPHPVEERYYMLESIDTNMFVPPSFR